MLTLWIVSIIVIDTYLIVVEYLKEEVRAVKYLWVSSGSDVAPCHQA